MTIIETKTDAKPDTILPTFLTRQSEAGVVLVADSGIPALPPLAPAPSRCCLSSLAAPTYARSRSREIALIDRFDLTVTIHDDYRQRPNPTCVLTYEGPYRCFHQSTLGWWRLRETSPGPGPGRPADRGLRTVHMAPLLRGRQRPGPGSVRVGKAASPAPLSGRSPSAAPRRLACNRDTTGPYGHWRTI